MPHGPYPLWEMTRNLRHGTKNGREGFDGQGLYYCKISLVCEKIFFFIQIIYNN